MGHIVLIGDSIFDNAAYVSGGPDVVAQLRQQLPEDWEATLIAIDGSVTTDVAEQLESIPETATHLVVSIGGNDALGYIDVLHNKAGSYAEVLLRFSEIAATFKADYSLMLEDVLARELPTVICTIYYPCFEDEIEQRLAVSALTFFNDVIISEAFAADLPLIDLRLVCNEKADYANPIEPSVHGGAKIAAAIKRAVMEHDFGGQSEVFI
jgi:hypothetical protein